MTELARAAVLDVIKMPPIPGSHYTNYTYTLSTSVAQVDLPMALRVEVSINSQTIDRLCTAVHEAAESDRGQPRRLRSLGQILYRLLFPDHSPEAQLMSSRLADWNDPLLISTNDAEIPWEVMHDGREFLSCRLALGRQMVTRIIFHKGRPIDEVGRALIISDPREDLPSAAAEAARVADFLQAKGIECVRLNGAKADYVTVTAELNEGRHDILHYSGHVGPDESGEPGMRLFDHSLSADEIRRILASPEGTKPPPVVFVNGCRSGDQISSVCGAFLHTGSRVVIGTRYRVIDGSASAFAEAWYSGLLSGKSAGEALRASRSSLREELNGTWASFILFGQPATQLWSGPASEQDGSVSVSQAKPAIVEPVAVNALGEYWTQRAEWLSPTLTHLVARITDSARDFGIVTTFHLAAGLLEVDTVLSNAVDLSGVERTTVADVLDIFTAIGEPGETQRGNGSDGEVEVSSNVRQIFERAIYDAAAKGAKTIGVDEVAAAFMANGGGRAGALLTELGVRLSGGAALFGKSNALQSGFVTPETQRIIESARFLATTRNEVISSLTLLLGSILAGSPVLREALLDQGPAGEKVVRELFSDGLRLTSRDFSDRAYAALERAFKANHGVIDETALLEAALSDATSTAAKLVQAWGIDLGRLRASFHRAPPPSDVDGAA